MHFTNNKPALYRTSFDHILIPRRFTCISWVISLRLIALIWVTYNYHAASHAFHAGSSWLKQSSDSFLDILEFGPPGWRRSYNYNLIASFGRSLCICDDGDPESYIHCKHVKVVWKQLNDKSRGFGGLMSLYRMIKAQVKRVTNKNKRSPIIAIHSLQTYYLCMDFYTDLFSWYQYSKSIGIA